MHSPSPAQSTYANYKLAVHKLHNLSLSVNVPETWLNGTRKALGHKNKAGRKRQKQKLADAEIGIMMKHPVRVELRRYIVFS